MSRTNSLALGEPLLDVGEIRLQAANHERPFEDVEIGRHGMERYGQRAGQIRDVQDLAVNMGQHRPERTQPPRRGGQSERRKIALQERGDIGVEPLGAGPGAGARVDRRKATPEPAVARLGGPGQLGGQERRQLDDRDAAGQCLADGPEQGRTRRSEHHEAASGRRAIEHMAQHRKQLRRALGLIEGDPAWMGVEKPLEIGRQERRVRRALQIEMPPVGQQVTHERALARLPRTDDEQRGKAPQQLPDRLALLPEAIVHVLYY